MCMRTSRPGAILAAHRHRDVSRMSAVIHAPRPSPLRGSARISMESLEIAFGTADDDNDYDNDNVDDHDHKHDHDHGLSAVRREQGCATVVRSPQDSLPRSS